LSLFTLFTNEQLISLRGAETLSRSHAPHGNAVRDAPHLLPDEIQPPIYFELDVAHPGWVPMRRMGTRNQYYNVPTPGAIGSGNLKLVPFDLCPLNFHMQLRDLFQQRRDLLRVSSKTHPHTELLYHAQP
jgi:hypothetical protein